MKNKEQQIGELLANSVEDHFFNPAALGRYLADQPLYTIARIMEVVAWIAVPIIAANFNSFSLVSG